MNPAKNTLVTLFFVVIFMDMLLAATAQSSCLDDEPNCNAQEEIVCKEHFSSLSCQIEFAQSKKCFVQVCINYNHTHFEKSPVLLNDKNLTEFIKFSVINDLKSRKQHCFVTCCLKENVTTENLCFGNKCQYKRIYILSRQGFHLNSASDNVCLSGNQIAIKKALKKKQLDKELMIVGLRDKVYYDKEISIKENRQVCQEEWQILDSNREKWKSVFYRNITNCLLKPKQPNQVINESYTLVLKGKNGSMDIWHFLVVKPGSPVTEKTTTIYNNPTMMERDTADKLQNRTSNSKEHKLVKLIDTENNLIDIIMENKDNIQIFVDVLNNITMKNCWTNLNNEKKLYPTKVMKVVDKFLENINTTNSSEQIKIEKENIVFQFDELKNKTISVNLGSDESLQVHIDESVIKNISSDDPIFYSVVLYKSLTYIIQMTEANRTNENTNHKDLLSDILSFTIHKANSKNLIKNITYRLNHKKLTSNTKCAYWSSSPTDLIGEWKTDGCFRTSLNEFYTECVCNHLTSFAILMSHHQVDNSVSINIMSNIGGVISILAVFLTFICYIILWRHVTTTTLNKSRAIILMNLCVSMFIANLLFLLSDHLKSYKITCTVTSILLHFFYLTVFFTMFVEGIDIFVTIVFVFSKIDVKKLILVAWGLPAIIVAISAGVTRLHGYGEDHCWLSEKSGLKWAFMGPAFFIIFTNLVITLVVLKNMLRNSEMIQKPIMERARAGMWGLVLFSPILGFTWCLGIFLFHKSVIVQYAFVACHSLQGVLIFLLHCLFSKQIKDGFMQYMKRIKNKSKSKSNMTNSVCKSVAFDKTQTPTLTINRSFDWSRD
ncbi:adhesion G protein-coupled receptor L4 isoform X2 [Octopus bimaculoides]|uniref:adhesion G protein-coupled receptor L4 isoform X2 n=1 Tax=Octopus bimaculoides TaxID=37653 RepID=UPI0022E24923|nr:adhesion G protein-coupled receptor L4 isoform X2 [Octopus bimaculoides]